MTSKRFPILKEKNHWICRILGFSWFCRREFFVCNSISLAEEKWGYFGSFIWKSVSRSTFLHFYSKYGDNRRKGWKSGVTLFQPGSPKDKLVWRCFAPLLPLLTILPSLLEFISLSFAFSFKGKAGWLWRLHSQHLCNDYIIYSIYLGFNEDKKDKKT